MSGRISFSRLDLVIGCLGLLLTIALLTSAQRFFGHRAAHTDIFAGVLLLAAGAQAIPMLGLGIFGRELLVHFSHSDSPVQPRRRGGDNIGLVFVVTFTLAFLGVFALLYSSVFVPLVLLGVVARLFYRPLSKNTPRARAAWRVLALSAIGFGVICVTFVATT